MSIKHEAEDTIRQWDEHDKFRPDDGWGEPRDVKLARECLRLSAELAELRRDAERYAWIKQQDDGRGLFFDKIGLVPANELDAAIDAREQK